MAADKRASKRGGGGSGKGAPGGGRGFPRWQAPYNRGRRPEQSGRPGPEQAGRRPPRPEPPPQSRGPQAGPPADGAAGRWVVLQGGSLSELASALNARGVSPARLIHLSAPTQPGELQEGGTPEWQALVWIT